MIDGSTKTRIEREHEYQTTRLRSFFKSVFQDEAEAWKEWQLTFERKGFDVAVRRLRKKPKTFGKLKGTLWLGFMKDQAFRDREFAQSEALKVAPYWRASEVQRQNMDREPQPSSRPDWKARSQEPSRDEERER